MKIIKGNWLTKYNDVMAAQHAPFVFIVSNGSKWLGEDPDDIDTLLGVLTEHTLDHHNIVLNPCEGVNVGRGVIVDGPRLFDVDGVVSFSGNFTGVSHVFDIITNDPHTIDILTQSINRNGENHV